MANVNKAMAGLKRLARKAAEDDTPAYCNCGNCTDAVFAAEEIMKSMRSGDCPMWVLQVAAVMTARASDFMRMNDGLSFPDGQRVFTNMGLHSHVVGMKPKHLIDHFDPDRKKNKPEPGKPV